MNKLLLAVLFFLMSAGVFGAVEASAQNSDAAARRKALLPVMT